MRYPIGTQTFSKMIENDLVYVDKTELMYELAQHNTVFLGRPRRFGKSLLLSTLGSYFRGEKELFAGLKIEKIEDSKPAEKQWIKRPVLMFDFNAEEYTRGVDRSESVIDRNLRGLEEVYGKNPGDKTLTDRFVGLIKRANAQTGQKVVILIDEYDKPMTATMAQPDLHEQVRNLLRSFYGVIKSYDSYIHFTLLTGVTKFSKLGIFSDLNMLEDVSLDAQFATICGITESEIDDYFAGEVHELAQAKKISDAEARLALRMIYNGYHFSPQMEDGVYNPFSLLNALSKRTLTYFWNSTGSSCYLGAMLRNSHLDVLDLEGCHCGWNEVMDYRAGDKNVIPLLYQSGYLTIKGYDPLTEEFALGFPNNEVHSGFVDMYMRECMGAENLNEGEFRSGAFYKLLLENDVDGFMRRLKAFYAGIPNFYKDSKAGEKYYQLLFYSFFTLLNITFRGELPSADGRMDAVVLTPARAFVFEFKLDVSAKAALQQIDMKRYGDQFAIGDRQVVKVGVKFSSATHGIEEWEAEI